MTDEEIQNALDREEIQNALDREEIVQSLDEQGEFIPERPSDCICSEETFQAYGCMCRRRIQPG